MAKKKRVDPFSLEYDNPLLKQAEIPTQQPQQQGGGFLQNILTDISNKEINQNNNDAHQTIKTGLHATLIIQVCHLLRFCNNQRPYR